MHYVISAPHMHMYTCTHTQNIAFTAQCMQTWLQKLGTLNITGINWTPGLPLMETAVHVIHGPQGMELWWCHCWMGHSRLGLRVLGALACVHRALRKQIQGERREEEFHSTSLTSDSDSISKLAGGNFPLFVLEACARLFFLPSRCPFWFL